MDEITTKLGQLRLLATRHNLDAILLQRVSSIAWATGGASVYVNLARSQAEVSLLITADHHYLLSNNIEAPRLQQEERLASQGWEFCISPWYQPEKIPVMGDGLRLGADGSLQGAQDLSLEMARLRARLGPEESQRFRRLGRLCAEAMDTATRAVRPGMSEHAIAGLLAQEAEIRALQPVVNLIAVDERIYDFRHPLPTDKKLVRYAMLVLCGRRWGLVCSLTRLVHFGQPDAELRYKIQAVARVDAAMIRASVPGRTLGEVFSRARQAYAEVGYPDEWQMHHQGGPAGYEPREFLATPGSTELIEAGQVYAWNPSIRGCKSEDSILITETGSEILTAIPGWPAIEIEMDGRHIPRPDLLVVD